ALKSAMLRTCGLAEEEFTGRMAHDLPMLYGRLCDAKPQTSSQAQALKDLPASLEDMTWLKTAYLATRYPNVLPRGQVPAQAYDMAAAQRAGKVAEQFP
ncbi:Sacs, partial [Symbiodinium pilosum]